MDPKGVSGLDPKLRQAYERVMGTPVSATDGANNSSQVVSFRKKARSLPILFPLAAVLFFIIYTLIWVKVLNLKVPFIP